MKLEEALLKIYFEPPVKYQHYKDVEVPDKILHTAEEQGWCDREVGDMLELFANSLMEKSMTTKITHTGSKHIFECTETTWKLYQDLIRAYCSGKTLQRFDLLEDKWFDLEQPVILNESSLHEYRIKPKEKSNSSVKVGQVWRCGITDNLFVITTETESKGVVFWLESCKFSWTGWRPVDVVTKHYAVKVADSVEEYFKGY